MARAATVAWLLPASFLLHDLEELPGLHAWLAARLPPNVQIWLASLLPHSPLDTALAMACLLLLFVWITAGYSQQPHSRWAWAYATLLGGFGLHGLGHLAQALAATAYMPGLITALLLVLPISVWLARRLLGHALLSGQQLLLGTLGGALLFLPTLLACLWLGRRLAEALPLIAQ